MKSAVKSAEGASMSVSPMGVQGPANSVARWRSVRSPRRVLPKLVKNM